MSSRALRCYAVTVTGVCVMLLFSTWTIKPPEELLVWTAPVNVLRNSSTDRNRSPDVTTRGSSPNSLTLSQANGVVTVIQRVTFVECTDQCERFRAVNLCRGLIWINASRGCVLISPNASVQYTSAKDSDMAPALAAVADIQAAAQVDREQRYFRGFQMIPRRDSSRGSMHDAMIISGMPLKHCINQCLRMNGTGTRNLTDPAISRHHHSRNSVLEVVKVPEFRVVDFSANVTYLMMRSAMLPRRDLCMHVVWRPATQTCYLKSDEMRTAESNETQVFARVDFPVLDEVSSQPDDQQPNGKAFLILAGGQFVTSRLFAVWRTWLCEEWSIAFVEPSPEVKMYLWQMLKIPGSHRQIDARHTGFVANPFCPDSGRVMVVWISPDTPDDQKAINGAWKNLLMIDFLRGFKMPREMSRPKWWIMVDDDTFMLPDNLNFVLQSALVHRPSNEAIYLGAGFTGTLIDNIRVSFIQGGAGIIMNYLAFERFSAHINVCHQQCKQWAGDIRLGCCAALSGVPTATHLGMWSRTPFLALGVDQRWSLHPFPVSFHQMRNDTWVADLWRLVQRHRNETRGAVTPRLITWKDLHQWLHSDDRYPSQLYLSEVTPRGTLHKKGHTGR